MCPSSWRAYSYFLMYWKCHVTYRVACGSDRPSVCACLARSSHWGCLIRVRAPSPCHTTTAHAAPRRVGIIQLHLLNGLNQIRNASLTCFSWITSLITLWVKELPIFSQQCSHMALACRQGFNITNNGNNFLII